ncbi:MAG: hypothetical protein HFG54_10195 [Lachnospiraceae bacterium]|nr:hypothetical protein [Lachnospiraceae bacterium]
MEEWQRGLSKGEIGVLFGREWRRVRICVDMVSCRTRFRSVLHAAVLRLQNTQPKCRRAERVRLETIFTQMLGTGGSWKEEWWG